MMAPLPFTYLGQVSFNQHHPELKEGEHFLTNTERENVSRLNDEYPARLLRIGKIAYAKDGKKLSIVGFPDYVPVFWKPKPIPAGKEK